MARPTETPEGFGPALRQMRTDAGLTQEELADRADVTARYVRQLEHGHQSPTLEVIGALAAGLGCRPHELILVAEREMGLS